MNTIACVLRSGSYYDSEWVRKLRVMCTRFAPPHRFVCLSDVEVPCERIALIHNWPGWWSKMELWRPDLFDAGTRVLYLDLDVLVIDDLDPLFGEPGDGMRAWANPWYPYGIGSGVMSWDAGDTELYYEFLKDPEGIIAAHGDGDQRFINEQRPDIPFFAPWLVASYKQDVVHGIAPEEARVVVTHGWPKHHQMEAGNLFRRWWESL
jgi:alpha-N-acetylglucosamine transferase